MSMSLKTRVFFLTLGMTFHQMKRVRWSHGRTWNVRGPGSWTINIDLDLDKSD
jgi:hypothetical protein